MTAGGRAETRRIPAASLIVFLCVALVGTLGHGEPASRGALRPGAEDRAAPHPPFVVTREITVESSIAFDGVAAHTTHQLILERPAIGVATLELTADGAFGTAIDRASASAEGMIDAEAAGAGADCRPATGRTVIPVNDLQRITADGVLRVDVRNTASVASRCAENRHTVRLRYEALAESLPFPPTRPGSSTTVAIHLHRLSGGKAPLALTLSSDRGAFAPLTTQVLLEPDETRTVAIRFRPATSGTVEGTLAIAAAGGAQVLVRLSGEALDPALVGVDPGTLDVSLPVGGGTTRTIQVGNLSGRSLDLEATIEGSAGPGAPAVCASPSVYVLEGISNVLARVDLHDGSVTHVGPQIFGASALALEAGDASVLVTTFSGEVYRLQTTTGVRDVLAQGLGAVQDAALSPDGATLYLLQRDAGEIRRFDVASGTVHPFVGGLSSPTRLDLTPDGATLWVATGSDLTRIEVATMAKSVFPELAGAASPRFDPGSGLVYVRTDSPPAIRAFDPVSRSFTTTGLVGSSEFTRFGLAAHGRLAFGLDEFEPVLKRMDLQDGQITPLTSDLESVRDLEVRADTDCLGTFLTVAPSTFSLPPNGSATLVAGFSALGARPGTLAAAIRLREAGQSPIVASVAASLTIAGAPHLALEGAPRTVEQVQTQRVGSHPGIVAFDLPMAAVTGPGVLAITTEAALHGSVGITLQGTSVGSDANPQCVRTTHAHDIGASILQTAAQAGSALVRLQLQDLEDFGIPCGEERFTARLTYAGPADSIDFGQVPAGSSAVLAPRLRNTGDQLLHVFGIGATGNGFSAATAPFDLAPGAAATLPVTFAATTQGMASGALRFETNDPDSPVVTLPLLAQGISPAALDVLPAQVVLEAAEEQSSGTTLSFDNGGDADVDYSLELVGSDPACPAERLITSGLETLDLTTLEQGTLPAPVSAGQKYGMATDPGGSVGFPVLRFGIVGADIATGANSLLRGMQDARAAALEPGGHSLLVTDSGDRLFRLDLRDRGLDPVGTTPIGGHVAVHAPTGKAYLTAKTGLVRSLDLATGAVLTVASGLVNPQGIVLSPDGATAYLIEARFGHPQGDRLVRVDLASGAIAPILEDLRGAEELVLDPSGGVAYLSEERDNRVIAVNLGTGQPTTLAESFRASGLGVIQQAACSGRFLELPPRTGKVPKHGSLQLPLQASAKGLAVGHYTATIVVHASDAQPSSRTIPVSFEVLADGDADGIADRDDNCPALANAGQIDADGDHLGDVCDNCPGASNPDQADRNADGAGDACQPDVALLAIHQDGGALVVVRLGLADPAGLPLSGEVALFDGAAATDPPSPRASNPGGPTTESLAGAQRVPVAGGPAGVTVVPVPATPVLTIPFAGRPPRRIDLSPLLASHAYRLRVSATNGTTVPFAAEAVFQHQSEGTLAFNAPPVASLAPLPVLECDRPGGTLASLSGAGSTDEDSSPGTQDDIASYAWTLDPGLPGERELGSGPLLQATLPLGTHTLLLAVLDGLGEAGQVSVPVTVADTRPPTLQAAASTPTLFPPNHELVPVRVQVTVADACDPAPVVTFAGAGSSEPDDAPGAGDGSTTGDIGAPAAAADGSADFILLLRSERAGTGAGRVYEIRLQAADASGHGAAATATIVVPHDLGHGPEPLLMRLEPGPSGAQTRLIWPGIAVGAAYDLIAGDLGAWRVSGGRLRLGSVRVLARGTAATSFVETDPEPLPGHARFYLIQAKAPGITPGYSTESAAWPRVPDSCEGGCP
jgi:sugar lactone lactonase YvrE